MTSTQTPAQKYTRKLYRFLRGQPAIEFKKLRKNRGNIIWKSDGDDVIVELDHREEVVSTLIHEFLHYEHYDWTEEQVLCMEKEIVDSLSHRQVRNILKRLVEII